MAVSQTSVESCVLRIDIIVLILAILVCALRVWSRKRSGAHLWVDDYLALAALPFVIALNSAFYWGVSTELQPNPHLTPAAKVQSSPLTNETYFIGELILALGLTLVKLSVLAFYARVFSVARTFKRLLWIVAGLCLTWSVTVVIRTAVECIPIQKLWRPEIPGKCYNSRIGTVVFSASDSALDMVILFLPLPKLWHLALSLRKKVEFSIVFVIGYCAFAMSAIRIAFSVTYYNSTPDTITYNTLSMAIVTVCELSVSLISACIPATYHIIREYLRKVKPILVAGRNTLQELTGYIHGPRRPKTFLQMPSLGPRFRASLGLFFRSTDLLDTGNEEGSEESKVGVVNR